MAGLILRMIWPTWEWQVEAATEFFRRTRKGGQRFVWLVSRQIGKTALLKAIAIRICRDRPGVYWFVAPSYDRCEQVYAELCDALADFVLAGSVIAKATKAGWVLRFSKEFTGGPPSELHLKSLGNPEMLRGATIHGLFGDEVGLWEMAVWDAILEPMLLVKNGFAVFAGTPPDPFTVADPDFFPAIWEISQSGEPTWWGVHRDYHAHPLAHFRAKVDEKRKLMPSDRFDREYLAKFTGREQIHLPRYKTWGKKSEIKTVPDGLLAATTIDLADNEREFGDKAAVVTSGVGAGNVLYILGADYAKNPSEVLDLCYLHKGIYRSRWCGGQDSAFDRGFKYTVQQAEMTRGPLNFIPLKIGGASKFRRIINGLEPLARMGKVIIHEDLRDLMNEWDLFPGGLLRDTRRDPTAHHYDMLDALAGRAEHLWRTPDFHPPEPKKLNTFNAAKAAVKARRRGLSSRDIRNHIFRLGVK